MERLVGRQWNERGNELHERGSEEEWIGVDDEEEEDDDVLMESPKQWMMADWKYGNDAVH